MKIYVRHKLYFYESCSGASGCGLELVSSFANLADYHGKTLFVSETVEYNVYNYVEVTYHPFTYIYIYVIALA